MAEWRVVVVRDVQALGTAPRLRSTLEGLLEKTIPGLLLILTGADPEWTRAALREPEEKSSAGGVRRALRSGSAGLAHGACTRARHRARTGGGASAGCQHRFDLGVLLQELNKLSAFAADKGTIDRAMVASLVGRVARRIAGMV